MLQSCDLATAEGYLPLALVGLSFRKGLPALRRFVYDARFRWLGFL